MQALYLLNELRQNPLFKGILIFKKNLKVTMLGCKCLRLVKQRLPCIRYYRPRKPLWMGTAKTKVLNVNDPPPLPKEEQLEIHKLYQNYRMKIKSIKKYCREEYYLKVENAKVQTSTESEANSEEVIELLKENEKENERVAMIRERDMARMVSKQRQSLEEEYLEHLDEMAKEQEAAEKKIEELKLDAKNYITTPEQLDEAVEKALLNAPVDRTFFITLDGSPNTEDPPKEKT